MEENKSKLNIQWFPGHMTKAKRQMEEHLKMVDMVIELRDARIPDASKNPLIDELTAHKPRLILLSKKDKADPQISAAWIAALEKAEVKAMAVDLLHEKLEKRITAAAQELMKAKIERMKRRGMRPRAIRAMVVGVPNVGKSTLINALAHRRAAVTGDRPGVTKALQWVKVGNSLELLDTPGVLWPKFEDEEAALRLAVTGAIRDEILPLEEVAFWAMEYLQQHQPQLLLERYGITLSERPYDNLLEIGRKRGYLMNGEVDEKRLITAFLREIRDGKIGAVSWEHPHEDRTYS
ncbi:MAG TPA: ribosome biogenesis GTPase YlqF [Candidatus Merdibacter merdavium]|uniref:Ribosome biogenesis GTPase A n=1 Tax=Candidatus Merdibacter merdavium TaxID=2838692 RepID=A0A9D2NRL0_9FIRM|nr:ribosome biogenesis GTPase YlqF [Candidatus Merdibacter merdavium]